jgi:hypothetical protein
MTFLNTIIYFIALVLSFYSFIGYGIFYQKIICRESNKLNNIFNYSFFGILLLLPLGFFNYLILGNSVWFNVVIILFGILFLLRKISKSESYLVIIFSLIFFSGILISKTHEDFSVYHFQHLKELSDNFLKFGLGNLDERYVYSSNFSYLQLVFQLPYLGLKLLNIPSFLIYLSLIGYLFEEIRNKKGNKRFISLFFLILLILKFKRFSEFGYDYIGQFLLIYLFIEYVVNYKNLKLFNYINFCLIFLVVVLIKISNLYFVPLLFFVIFVNNKNIKKILFNKTLVFLSLLMLFIFTTNSFIKTGCFNYLLKPSCLSIENSNWVINYSKIDYTKEVVTNWTKGFHLQRKNVLDKVTYNKNYNWVNNWIKIHFLVKILDYLIVIFVIFLVSQFLILDKPKIDNKKKKNSNILLNTSIFLSFLIWFSFFPQFRFGIFGITIIIFILLKFIFNPSDQINNKKFMVFFLMSIIYFNFINVSRIYNDFNRNDIYQFKNFPWIVFPNLKFEKEKINDLILYRSSENNNFWRTCWNAPGLCVNHDRDINLIKNKRLIFIEDSHSN